MDIKGKFSVVSEPEIKTSKAGSEYATFRVAYNERTKDADGNWGSLKWENAVSDFDTVAEFYDVVAFPTTDGFDAVKGLGKGDFVEVTGRRSIRGYVKDGSRRTAQSIAAQAVSVVNARQRELVEPAL